MNSSNELYVPISKDIIYPHLKRYTDLIRVLLNTCQFEGEKLGRGRNILSLKKVIYAHTANFFFFFNDEMLTTRFVIKIRTMKAPATKIPIVHEQASGGSDASALSIPD